MIKEPPFKRLYRKTQISSNECWEWDGQTGSSGYGQIKAFGFMVSCHRLSYELYHGRIPPDLEVMHSCNNRICINPDHLSLGTHQENMTQASEDGAWNHVVRVGVSGAGKPQSKQVLVLGSAYGSMKEAERSLGLGSGTVSFWLKKKSSKAKQLTMEEYLELKI